MGEGTGLQLLRPLHSLDRPHFMGRGGVQVGVPESVTCAYRHEQRPLGLRLLSVLVSVSVSVSVLVLAPAPVQEIRRGRLSAQMAQQIEFRLLIILAFYFIFSSTFLSLFL